MIAPARLAALRILEAVYATDAHSDELLRSPEVNALSVQDRNLVTTIVLGTLRWRLLLERRIHPLLTRPNATLALPIEVVLQASAFQLLYLERIPAHAVLFDAVECIKHSSERGAAGMVNAVLRKIAAQPRISSEQHAADAEAAHPAWMTNRWRRSFGAEITAAICRSHQQPAPVSVRLLTLEAEQELLSDGIELAPGEFLATARRVLRGDISATRAYAAGHVRIQDEGSQLVAELASAARSGAQQILDTCAAPGGKTAILAERNISAEILAIDASKRRLTAMRRSFSPGDAARIRFENADLSTLKLKPEYDLILCDVPCSGTGTIARNPEIRFRIDEEGLHRQHARQTAILASALRGLAPGGRLLYSTCSLEPEENEAVLEECLSNAPGYVRLSLATAAGQLAESGVLAPDAGARLNSALKDGFLRTVPGMHSCDGFFATLLERGS